MRAYLYSRYSSSLICGGKGICECGTCKCNNPEIISGQFCDCDNTQCPINSDGKLCSGNGECQCGQCICEEGFGGDDCACVSDTKSCEEGGSICNGHGKCVCGICTCNQGWTGATCNIEEKSEVLTTDENNEIPKLKVEKVSYKESEEKANEPESASVASNLKYIDVLRIISGMFLLLKLLHS